MYLRRLPSYAGNVALILNPSSGHASQQYYVVFNDNFMLILALRMKTIPANWDNLVEKSLESASNVDIDLSKVWFNQNHYDPHEPDSSFTAIFDQSNNALPATEPTAGVRPMHA